MIGSGNKDVAMNAVEIRPRVADLIYHLYDRPLHPELFEVLAMRCVSKRDYQLTVRITRTGHAISWDSPQGHLTEIAAAVGATLPTRGRPALFDGGREWHVRLQRIAAKISRYVCGQRAYLEFVGSGGYRLRASVPRPRSEYVFDLARARPPNKSVFR